MSRNVVFAAVGTAALVLSTPALADEYRPGDYFNLDLSKAVLSPKRLGPPTEFARVPVEAKSDPSDAARVVAEPKPVQTTKVRAAHAAPAPQRSARTERRAHARAWLARRHVNPLDAQARDTRIQTWPCRSGGICNWR
ncbi:hypothetical protein [Bradyrhizobium cenepequi]|uniref:hypothetical protein n=1 Tax=Bradyrhizobium cenepequi TaxID=2821403 RepID=UPI001CE2FFB3